MDVHSAPISLAGPGRSLVVLGIFAFSSLLAAGCAAQVLTGIDVLERDGFSALRGKRVGLITNPTGVTKDLRSTIDVLNGARNVRLTALYGPEHGVRGNVFAGKKVADFKDRKTGLPVYSLYGSTRKPTPEMLRDVDLLVYDIQDIGSRAYTYIYTMAYAMEAAREKGIPFVVLDRPNPLGADLIEGPVLDPAFSSFIGLYPIPYIYGLTVGELAQYFNSEFGIGVDLRVVKMANYRRSMRFDDTGLPWIAPSPHVPHGMTSTYIAATGVLGELEAVNTGVGYTQPFEMVAQSWIDPDAFAERLNLQHLPGVRFRPCYIRPYYFSFAGEELGGVQIHVLDRRGFSPMRAQLFILRALLDLYPEQKIFETKRISSFDKAMGTDTVRLALLRGTHPDVIIRGWQQDLQEYGEKRRKYLLYR